jgi:release factor glutamine methyltransferase
LSTIQELFGQGRRLLAGVAAPWIEAKVLLLEATGMGEVDFLGSPTKTVAGEEERKYFGLIRRRLSGIPLARVTGRKEFWSLSFEVAAGVFIPRPETELLAEKVLELSSRKEETIIDVGTGCGNIALALAQELPLARIIATDISARALRAARRNALSQGRPDISFLPGSLFSAFPSVRLEGRCDFIVSNPPYVSTADWVTLPPEVKDHEPRRALVAGRTGLEFIERLIRGSLTYLKPRAHLLFEVGLGQADQAMALFDRKWTEIEFYADLRGIPRVLKGRKA